MGTSRVTYKDLKGQKLTHVRIVVRSMMHALLFCIKHEDIRDEL